MKKILSICIALNLFIAASGQQQNNIVISGNFVNTPFTDFVEKIEKSTSLKFYYNQEWTDNVKITCEGKDINLSKMLNDQINKFGLQLFIEGTNIFIYPGEQIITELPLFNISGTYNDSNDSLLVISETEKKYIEGKLISSVEILEIGDKRKSGSFSKCVIEGKIVDESNSEPLIGATIYIEELKSGTVTDTDGKFKIFLKPGKYKALFNYMSMKPKEYYLQVYSDGNVDIKMRKELIALDEVNVTADRYDNVRGIQMGYERISAKTMKEIPIAFGERDVIKVAQMLPGVLNVGEGASGFNVRGGAEDQNMFYINKIPIYNTSHLLGFFTVFSPDIINDFSFYKSNIPACYGGRLSSVFNITTRQGNKKKIFGQGGISPITAHSSLEIPVIKDKLSIVASFRSSYSDWILKRIKNEDIKKSNASFYDVSLSVNAEINKNNLLRAFMYISKDEFSLSSINDYNYSNKGASIIWKHIFSPLISSDFAIIYSNYSFCNADKTNISTAFMQQYMIEHYETKADFSILSKSDHKITFGTSGIFYNLNRGIISPYGEMSNRDNVNLGKEKGLECAFYFADEFQLFTNLTVSSGIRYSIYSQVGPATVNFYNEENNRNINNIVDSVKYNRGDFVKIYSGPEYRFALNYSFGNASSLKASYNRLFQYIFMLSNTNTISPSDKWKLCDYHIAPPVADQISIGYYRNFKTNNIKASIELYHKWINNQVEFKDGVDFTSDNPIETNILQGKQRIDGIELMISKNSGKLTGWISYCYSRSLIKVDGGLPENQINYGIEYPSNYDRPHSVNLVMNFKFNRRLSFSSNFAYTTGRPITYPVSIYYSEGQAMVNFSKRNEFRMPDYVRMDLSINIEGNLLRKKPIHSSWSLNLYNALGRKNAYSVYFEIENGKINGHKMSIFGVPILTLSWNYKFGNYLND